MKAYSTDLRQKIIEAYQRGQGTQRAIAEHFGVRVSFVEKLLQRYRTTGNVAAKAHGGGQKRRLDATGDQRIRAWIHEQPDPGSGPGQALTLAELRAKARQELGVTLWVWRRCGAPSNVWGLLSLSKDAKKKTLQACEGDTERVRQARPGLPRPDPGRLRKSVK